MTNFLVFLLKRHKSGENEEESLLLIKVLLRTCVGGVVGAGLGKHVSFSYNRRKNLLKSSFQNGLFEHFGGLNVCNAVCNEKIVFFEKNYGNFTM